LFDLCTFDVSGWYFGKTAGVLGTLNNEMYDDHMTANNQFATSQGQFVNSWSLPLPECQQKISETDMEYVRKNVDLKVANLCSTYFSNPLSYFEACFSVVDPQPFYDMCLDLGVNQGHNFLPDGHPADMGACTVAISYMEACLMESIALRVPDTCV
jgi:C8 domain